MKGIAEQKQIEREIIPIYEVIDRKLQPIRILPNGSDFNLSEDLEEEDRIRQHQKGVNNLDVEQVPNREIFDSVESNIPSMAVIGPSTDISGILKVLRANNRFPAQKDSINAACVIVGKSKIGCTEEVLLFISSRPDDPLPLTVIEERKIPVFPSQEIPYNLLMAAEEAKVPNLLSRKFISASESKYPWKMRKGRR